MYLTPKNHSLLFKNPFGWGEKKRITTFQAQESYIILVVAPATTTTHQLPSPAPELQCILPSVVFATSGDGSTHYLDREATTSQGLQHHANLTIGDQKQNMS